MIEYETIDTSGVAFSVLRPFGPQRPESLEDVRQLDPTLQGPVIARGDDRPVGDRVGVGDADLDQIGPALNQLADQRRGRRQVGIARGDERHQSAALSFLRRAKGRRFGSWCRGL